MMFGVAAIVTSLTVSALAAIVIDTTYQTIAERRWPAGLSSRGGYSGRFGTRLRGEALA
jgi:hypothetical protein